MTFENITIGCGQNCAAMRAYCGHAQTEKLKTTASTPAAAMHPAAAHGDVVLPDDRVASDDVEPAGLEPLDQLLAKLPVYRLERLLQVTAAVTEIENADADPGGLKVIEHDTSLCHSDRAG